MIGLSFFRFWRDMQHASDIDRHLSKRVIDDIPTYTRNRDSETLRRKEAEQTIENYGDLPPID